DRHVGNLFANQAEVGDDFAKRLALLGILNRMLQRYARAAHAHRTQFETAHIKNVEGDHVPLADVAEHVFDRHFAIIEDDGAGGRPTDAHLVLFAANREAGEVSFDQKRGKFLAVDFGEDGEQVSKPRVGDPHLLAIQDVMLAIGRKLGASAAVQRVGTEINDRQKSDAGMGAPGGGESGVFSDAVADNG